MSEEQVANCGGVLGKGGGDPVSPGYGVRGGGWAVSS